MAERSDEIFIYLKAFDSDKTARQIKKVADELERLDKAGKNANKSMGDIDKTTDSVAQKHDKLGTEVEKTTKKTKQSSKAWAEAEKVLKEFGVTADTDAGKLKLMQRVHAEVSKAIIDNNKKINQSESDRIKQAQRFIQQGVLSDAMAAEKAAKAKATATKKRQDAELKGLHDHLQAMEREENSSRQREMHSLGQHFAETIKATDAAEKQTARIRNVAHTQALRDMAKMERAAAGEAKKQEQRAKKEEQLLKKLSSERKKALQDVGSAAKGFMPHVNLQAQTALWLLLGAALPDIATAASAAAAGVLALLNGLGQLSGVLGAIPAGLLAAAQGLAVFTLGFRGLGAAMTNQVQFDRLGAQAQNLVLTLNQLKPVFYDIRSSIQNSLLNGLSTEILNLSKYYLPLFNKELSHTAALANTGLQSFGGWLGSREGRGTISSIMSTNSVVVGKGVDAGQRLLQTFLLVANAAGPMLVHMATDIDDLSVAINNWVFNNRNGIGAFFNHGYSMFKGAISTIKDYGEGVYNIIKLSSPLTDHILSAITKTGQQFLNWSSSKSGVAAIQKYFKDMQPDLDALAGLAGSLAKHLFQLSNNKGFLDFVEALSKNTIPAAANALNKVAESGALTSLANLIAGILTIISKLPDSVVKVMPYLIAGGIALTAGATLLMNAIKLFKAIGVLTGLRSVGTAAATSGVGTAEEVGAGSIASRVGLGAGTAGIGGGAIGSVLLPALAVAGGTIATSRIVGGENTNYNAKASNGAIVQAIQNGTAFKGIGKTGGLGKLFEYGALNVAAQGKIGQALSFGQGINSVGAAGKLIYNPNLMQGITDGWAGSFLTHLFGSKTDTDNAKATFKQVDKALTTMKKTDAAKMYSDYVTQLEQAGLTMKQIMALFPQYNQYLAQQKNAVSNTGTISSGPGTTAPDKSLTYVNAQGKVTKVNTGAPGTASAYFAGGLAGAGKAAIAGELGPEMTVDRLGRIGMVGISGIERFTPSRDTAIIPASATSNPLTGDYGNAPDWARKAIQSRLGGIATPSSVNASEGSVTYAPQITMGGSNLSQVEITNAVMEGIRRADRDRRERR